MQKYRYKSPLHKFLLIGILGSTLFIFILLLSLIVDDWTLKSILRDIGFILISFISLIKGINSWFFKRYVIISDKTIEIPKLLFPSGSYSIDFDNILKVEYSRAYNGFNINLYQKDRHRTLLNWFGDRFIKAKFLKGDDITQIRLQIYNKIKSRIN